MNQDIIPIKLDSLRFLQDYVKRPTVEAKRWIEHLQTRWGGSWRDHRTDLTRDVEQKVIDQLAFVDLNLPLKVEQIGDIYVAQNGTHTAYSYWQRKIPTISARLSTGIYSGKGRLYTFEEIRVEED